MDPKPMWTNPTVTAKVKQLAAESGLQPYYDDQERAIQQFADAVVHDVVAVLANYIKSVRYIDDPFDFAEIVEEKILDHYRNEL